MDNHYDVIIVGGCVAGRLLRYRPNSPRVNLYVSANNSSLDLHVGCVEAAHPAA